MIRWLMGATLVPWTLAAQVPDTLPLGQALRLALANNRELAQAEAAVRGANARVTEAFATAMPDVSASASYQRNFRVQEAFLPAIIFDPTADPDDLIPVRFGADNQWFAGLTLSQTLFEYGVLVGIGAAGRFRQLENERARGVAQQVVTTVRRAYFDVLLATEQERLTAQSVERVRQTLAETQALNQQGLASDYDVLRLEVQLANLEPNLRRARDQVRATRRQLAITVGLEPEVAFVVSGSLHTVVVDDRTGNDAANLELLAASGGVGLEVLTYDDAWRRATIDRSDVRQTQLAVSLEQSRVKVEIAEYFPRVSLFSNYNITAQENRAPNFFGDANSRTTSFFGGIRVEMPIFRGFTRPARVTQARASLAQAEAVASLTEDQAAHQLQSLFDGLAEARDRVASQRRAVEQARRGFEIASAEYRAGTGSQLQITDAEVALRQSEFNYAQAVYDYLTTRSALEAAVGTVAVGDGQEF
ncbi:MAG: TolC family protein [Gemmatimonadales bacterium]